MFHVKHSISSTGLVGHDPQDMHRTSRVLRLSIASPSSGPTDGFARESAAVKFNSSASELRRAAPGCSRFPARRRCNCSRAVFLLGTPVPRQRFPLLDVRGSVILGSCPIVVATVTLTLSRARGVIGAVRTSSTGTVS